MKKGFTLIELLVVVLIIGILAAVALPQYRVAVARAKVAKGLPLLRSIVDAKERYRMANGTYTADLDNLDVQIPYTSKTERDYPDSWVYEGTPVGTLHIAQASTGVFWGVGSVTINFYTQSHSCYGWSTVGDRVCKSLGKPTGGISGSSGYPVYELDF